MRSRLTFAALLLFVVRPALAQAPAEPPPLWEAQVGASFVGTTGNSNTDTLGADATLRRRWPVWQMESNGTAIRTTDHGVETAERYLAAARAKRRLTAVLSFAGGERIEHDEFAGIQIRSVADAGLNWALVRAPRWSLEALTSLAWLHESRLVGSARDNPTAILQALSRIPFGGAGDMTQRIAWYPDFNETAAYRTEGELTAQAAMNSRLALKFGYLVRYANDPVPGFLKTDSSATASVVLRWRSIETAP